MAGETDGVEIVARRGKLIRHALTGWGVLMYAFLFIPVLLLVMLSFNSNRYGSFPIQGFTTQWYSSVLQSPDLQTAIKTSLMIAAEVTAIAAIVGTAAAFPLVRSRLRFKSALRVGFTLPIMIPGVLIGVSLLSFFTNVLNVQLNTQTAVIGQAVYTTPYVVLIVAARLEGFDPALERAASDLGADAFQRFRRIVLPLIGPAILAGALFAFTMSLDEFVITYFIIGAQITLPIYIYTQIKFGITPAINAVATLLIVSSLTITALGIAVPRLVRASVRSARRRLRARQAMPAAEVLSGPAAGTN